MSQPRQIRPAARDLATDTSAGLIAGLAAYLTLDGAIPFWPALLIPAAVLPAIGALYNARRDSTTRKDLNA